MKFEGPMANDLAQKDDIGPADAVEEGIAERERAENAVDSRESSLVEALKGGDVVQVRGETEPAVVEDFLLGVDGKRIIAHVKNMVTGAKRDVAASDILRHIEGANATDNEHLIAGNVVAQEANDQIEGWGTRESK